MVLNCAACYVVYMRILSFDCALKNLGICCLDYDQAQCEVIAAELSELHRALSQHKIIVDNAIAQINGDLTGGQSAVLASIKLVTDAPLASMQGQLIKLHRAVESVVTVVFFNVVNMFPARKDLCKTTSRVEQTIVLKQVLCMLDVQVGRPDVVLIEFQMINFTQRCVSHQIAYHYADCSQLPVQPGYRGDVTEVQAQQRIIYHAHLYPLLPLAPRVREPVRIEIIGTGFKNALSFSEDGQEHKFAHLSKANKKHTNWNCKYWMKMLGSQEQAAEFELINNKTYDIADAFMGALGWIAAGMPNTAAKKKRKNLVQTMLL